MIDQAFADVVATYQHAFMIRITGEIAKLHRFSSSMTVNTPVPEINLAYPSFLRILNKTGMPYHGYLVDSPLHREFFKALGMDDLPECVTAVPIRSRIGVWGVLVGLGSSSLQDLESLKTVENAAQPLSLSLGGPQSSAA